MSDSALPAQRQVRGACPHDCPDTCALLWHVTETPDGPRLTKVTGAADHGPTAGTLCTKVTHYADRVHSPDRLSYPQRRVGPKGPGARFERIGWDEALDEIAGRLSSIAAEHGGEAILPYSYAGHMGLLTYGSMDRRFFHRLGASRLERTICSSAGAAGYKATIGASQGMAMEAFVDAKLILIWGSNSVVSNLHFWSRVVEARRRGAHVIAIDPVKSETARRCDEHIAPLPGTDAALALGLMHVLIAENLIDADYIARYTLGFDELKARAEEYPPERVAAICGLPMETIVNLARRYGSTRPAAIRANYGLNRHAGGGMALRTIACLPALVGAWRDAAGGILLSSSGFYPLNPEALERPDLQPSPLPRVINMSRLGEALADTEKPVKALFVYNSNPAAVAPDGDAVLRGLCRDDLFVVVHELFQTDTADYADLLLPATSAAEQLDIHRSYGHRTVLINQPALPPLDECLPNTELFRRLARRMGFTEPCFAEDDLTLARQALNWQDPRLGPETWPTLMEQGHVALKVAPAPFANGGFPTLSGKCEFRSAALAAAGLDPLPTYIPPREGPNSAAAASFPLMLLTPPAKNFLNTSFANLPRFCRDGDQPLLHMHAIDAAARNLDDGAWVRIHNGRGQFHARLKVGDEVRPGVVMHPSIWWRKRSPDQSNCNAVTSQAITDLGGGATFYDCAVEVDKAASQQLPGAR